MDSIEKIIQQINQQAAEERTAYETQERAQQALSFETEQKQIQQEEQKRREKQMQQLKQHYKQLHSRQQVDNRQQVLTEKQQFLGKLFQEALAAMEAWTPEEQRSFAEAALQTLPLTGEQVFIAGVGSAEHFSAEWLAEINPNLPYTLKLSQEQQPKQSGFIVDDNGVQYNFLYKNLLQDIEESMRFEMATYLFG